MLVLLPVLSTVALVMLEGIYAIPRSSQTDGGRNNAFIYAVEGADNSPLQSLGNLAFLDISNQDSQLIEGSPSRSHPDITLAIARDHHHYINLEGSDNDEDEHIDKELSRKRRDVTDEDKHVDIHKKPDVEDEKDDDDDDDDTVENSPSPTHDNSGMSQHFFPSFASLFPAPPPLGHSRPQILFQDPSQRPSILRSQQNNFQPLGFGTGSFRENPFVPPPPTVAAAAAAPTTSGVLGSGNFGVIRGGTFFNDGDGSGSEYNEGRHVYNPYYQNGHGRPAFYNGASNPRPQHYRGNDFFANFRDFADINTPTKASFSEYYVVYVNKNASRHDDGKPLTPIKAKPKNIIEQLRLIDEENENENNKKEEKIEDEKLAKKSSKLSHSKQKLALLNQDKYNKQNKKQKVTTISPKDLHEPLLALS